MSRKPKRSSRDLDYSLLRALQQNLMSAMEVKDRRDQKRFVDLKCQFHGMIFPLVSAKIPRLHDAFTETVRQGFDLYDLQDHPVAATVLDKVAAEKLFHRGKRKRYKPKKR